MFRVGILGSDSSHALAFSKLCNIPDPATHQYNFSNVRITAIYGHDKKQTEKVAAEGKIDTIASKSNELFGKVDAVMILFRDGNLHAPYALPFIKAGIPVWIDKPITIKIEEAEMLIEEANKNNTLVTGGSTCKYSLDVLALKGVVDSEELSNIVSGYLNFPGDINSPYNGIFFYGPHIAEMLFTIFGYDVKSITTTRNNSDIICVANYDKFSVVLNFAQNAAQNYCIVQGDKKSIVREINIDSYTYKLGFEKFVEMLETGRRPLSLDKLIAPTVFLTAINKSLETGKEIFLK